MLRPVKNAFSGQDFPDLLVGLELVGQLEVVHEARGHEIEAVLRLLRRGQRDERAVGEPEDVAGDEVQDVPTLPDAPCQGDGIGAKLSAVNGTGWPLS